MKGQKAKNGRRNRLKAENGEANNLVKSDVHTGTYSFGAKSRQKKFPGHHSPVQRMQLAARLEQITNQKRSFGVTVSYQNKFSVR